MPTTTGRRLLGTVIILALACAPAYAQRGGRGGRGGGGGARMGGGGMARGGGMPAGGFGGARPGGGYSRSPAISQPRPAPRPAAPAGMNRPAPRPATPGAGGAARPATRPAGTPGGNRPSTLPAGPGLGNRPPVGGAGAGNRPGVGQPGVGPGGNRPGVGQPGVGPGGNRPGVGQPGVGPGGNRPGVGQPGVANRPATRPGGGNTINNINTGNRPLGPNRPGGPVDPGFGYRPPAYNNWRGGYGNYHPWANGYWHGYHANNNWGWGSYAAAGVVGWALGSSFYNWGYSAYANPYYGVAAAQPIVIEQVVDGGAPQTVTVPIASYDYSQPLDTQSTPPPAEVADPALAQFEAARVAFRSGDYATALTQTDAALKALPNDATLHEFRALVLFAVGQYDQAAGPLYAVLSVGPGWDWTTLIGLYPNVGVYTDQVRKLEAFVKANPKSTSGHFVLAYHYLTQNHVEPAVAQLRKVVALAPQDTLSAQLIAQFSPAAVTPADPAAPAAAPAPVAAAAVKPGNLAGRWTASAPGDTTITLDAQADGTFTWTVTAKGQPHAIRGQWSLTNDLLTLAPDGPGGPMVGRTTWKSDAEWTFTALGGGPQDPGLNFHH